MSYSIKVTLGCNGKCQSCYETEIRKAGHRKTDTPAILSQLDKIIEQEKKSQEKNPDYKSHAPCIHGGEPLLVPIPDLEKLADKILSHWGYNNIQTNGTLITDNHIEFFKRYKFSVGVSIDGDTADLNRGRWNLEERTDKYIQDKTDLVINNIRKLRDAGISVSIIIVLRKYNASPKRIDDLILFIRRMVSDFGIYHFRTNPGIVFDDKLKADEELKPSVLAFAFKKLAQLKFNNPNLSISPFQDVVDLLMGYYNQTCNFNDCDPFYTRGEVAISSNGELTNCLKTGMAMDGIQSIKSDGYHRDRHFLLAQLPQEYNGCKGCKFFHMCGGGCPGEGIDNDWRNRTRFCEAWKSLFEYTYNRIKGMIPNLNLVPDFYPVKPTPKMIQKSLWVPGGSTYRQKARFNPKNIKPEKRDAVGSPDHGDSHGDHHGDLPHQDSNCPKWRKANPNWKKKK